MANLHLALITSIPDQAVSTFRFNERGGSVGRAQDCDWTLLDTERFISNKHIILSFVNDHFLVTDTSSNGTYVNDSPAPLGKGNSHRLQLNDVIKLGTLSLQVSEIDLSPAYAPAAIPVPPAPVPANASNPVSADADLLDLVFGSARAPRPVPAHNGFGDSSPTPAQTSASPSHLGLFDILSGDMPETPSAASAFSPATQAAAFTEQPANIASASPFAPQQQSGQIPDNWDLDEEPTSPMPAAPAQTYLREEAEMPPSPAPVAPMLESVPEETPPPMPVTAPVTAAESVTATEAVPAVEATPQSPVAPAVTASSDTDFFSLLYQSLGLPREYMHTVDQAEFARDLTQVLMTSTQGLMALLAGRSVLKQESRLSMTMIKPQSNNPIKFSLDPSDTLEMLLVKKKPGYLTAQAAYAEAMHDLQLHQMAFLSGLQASLEGVLKQLSPDTIEQEAQEKSRGLTDFRGHSRKWETFISRQEKLQKQIKENLNDILSAHFSAAYEDYINNAKNNH